jgi:imidazole glycerol-phosphate synthase subunit HisF
MIRPRIIPVLLLRGDGLVKGIQFKDYKYVGDPMNAVKIFSTKEVDELLFLDIFATTENRAISVDLIRKIADEAYMPFGVGGGIRTVGEIKSLLAAGAEKISLNTAAVENPGLIEEAAGFSGSQSVVVSIDVSKNWKGNYQVFTHSGNKPTGLHPLDWAIKAEKHGAGEILLNSINRDGTGKGYDLDLITEVSKAVTIPVIACGGAGKMQDLADAIHVAGASAVAAGSFFVFYGTKRAVLINFPPDGELQLVWKKS